MKDIYQENKYEIVVECVKKHSRYSQENLLKFEMFTSS